MTFLKPRALRAGDEVGIVAPASPVKPELLEAGCREVEALGFRVRLRDDIHSTERYLAGSAQRRAEEFLQMLLDPGVAAIFAARGGYGSGHLLPLLDMEAIRSHPKIFCGASDLTMLLALFQRAGVVAFHSPMVATALRGGPERYDRDLFRSMLVDGAAVKFSLEGCEVLAPGSGEGRLTGGCLSLLVSTLATPWEVSTEGAILVLEDIDTRPYQVDRMLTHLRQAGKLDRVRGIVFGEMVDCDQHPDQGYSIQQVIASVLGDLGVPLLFGFPTGHSRRPNAIVPFGVAARLDLGSERVFELLEPAVERP